MTDNFWLIQIEKVSIKHKTKQYVWGRSEMATDLVAWFLHSSETRLHVWTAWDYIYLQLLATTIKAKIIMH